MRHAEKETSQKSIKCVQHQYHTEIFQLVGKSLYNLASPSFLEEERIVFNCVQVASEINGETSIIFFLIAIAKDTLCFSKIKCNLGFTSSLETAGW